MCICVCVYSLSFFFQEEVLILERILLQTIKFDLQVEHPYSYLLKYAKCLKGNLNTEFIIKLHEIPLVDTLL